jgi:hypothetical protein
MPEIGTSGSMSGMGNGALPHGPSYRAHPRLYRSGPEPMRRHVRSRRKLTYEWSAPLTVDSFRRRDCQSARLDHPRVIPSARRRSDRIEVQFAAVHESASGTKLPRAYAAVCPQLVKADMRSVRQDAAFDPSGHNRD